MDESPASGPSSAVTRGARVFFALVPDDGVRAALAPLARRWAQESRGRASMPESMHLTLAFIGDAAPSRLERLAAVGCHVPHVGFELDLDRVGGFRRARVAWVAPSALPQALLALQGGLVAALAAEGFPVERRPFQPHLTLARHCSAPVVPTTMPAIRWLVSRLALIASTLDPAGARYRELAGWDLRDTAAC